MIKTPPRHDFVRSRDVGWRSRPVFAALGLRAPLAQHTHAEGRLLQKAAAGARRIVEIGVAEGPSAWELRQVIDPAGTLHLIDPFHPPGRLFGLNMTGVTARRLVGGRGRGTVAWHRAFSTDAAKTWSDPIDVLFIDGDHSPEGVRRDWEDWSGFVVEGGRVILHDAYDGGPRTPMPGPAQVLAGALADPAWELMEGADTLAVLTRRRAGAA